MIVEVDYGYSDCESAIHCLSSDCTRDEWIKIGCGLKDALNAIGYDGYELFKAWSSQSSKYNERDCKTAWQSIKLNGGITKATFFQSAYQAGWSGPAKETLSTKKESIPSYSQDKPLNTVTQNSTSDDEKRTNVLKQWNSFNSYDRSNPHEYLAKKGLTDKLNGYEVNLRTGYSKAKLEDGQILGHFFAYPLIDLETSEIAGFNRISVSGKMLGKDSKKAGNAGIIGILDRSTAIVCICEGFADGLHIHHATKHTTLVANDAGNIANVAKRVRKIYPQCKIVICADNDDAGRDGANKAIKGLTNAVIAYPVNKDFDLDVQTGLNISESIQKAIDSIDSVVATDTSKEVATNTEFHMESNGLFYTFFKQQGKEIVKVDVQITFNPFEIVAKTHDSYHESWSKLISFKCDSGQIKQVVIPLAMTSGDGSEYRKLLLDCGLRVSNDKFARNKLTEYLLTTEPSKTLHCLNKTGWYNGVYVLPNEVIGTTKEEIFLQISNSIKESYESKGTLEQWQENVARYCIGNSRLTLAVSYAFASMILEFSGTDSGGIQFIGQSSIGKSTLAFVAGSVFGGHSYVNQWRNTSNALESVATSRNDSLLILDEMGQVDAKEVGAIAYMLANGSGKGRMDKSANLKPTSKWRLLFLSTGEVGLVDHMKSSGKQTMAGQESRLIDLPSDTGLYGIFENLHECKDGSELSRLLRGNTKKFYGTAQRAFLTRLLQTYDADTLSNLVNNLTDQFLDEYVQPDSDGQVKRVAQRFALAVIGGEIATSLGITGWATNDSEKAAAICFNDWLQARGGTGSIETKNALQQVRYFFEQFGFSRFKDIKAVGTDDEKTVQNLVGFRETTGVGDDAETCFYVYPGVFTEEICKGLNPKLVAKTCVEYGLLKKDSEGKYSISKNLPYMGKKRVYHFTNKVLGD